MIQFLHEPSITKVEYASGIAFTGFVGVWALAARILKERKRDINIPEVFKKEMYAEDDIEEIVVEGAAPVPLANEPQKPLTPRRVCFAVVCIAAMTIGSWFAVHNGLILRAWTAGELCQSHYDYKGAEKYYHDAISIDPLVRRSHLLMGEILLKEQQESKAIPELTLAANGEKKDPVVHVILGDTLQSVGRYNEAIPEYHLAISIAPKQPKAYIRLGSCLVKLDRLNDAVKEFHYALLLDPKDVRAVSNLGSLLLTHGYPKEGIALLRRAVELAPFEVGARNTLATHYARLKMYPEAVAEFRDLLAIDPQFTIGYFNLGLALKQTGDYQAAEDAFTSYLKMTFSVRTPGEDAKTGVPQAFDELARLQKQHSARNMPRANRRR